MINATEALHRAAQYLSAAGISFLDTSEDDSHTNLGWHEELLSLTTHPLNAMGDMLALNYESYSLDFVHAENGLLASFALSGARHLDLVNWIEHERQVLEIERPYRYELHYELPYEAITDAFVFPVIQQPELDRLAGQRTLVKSALRRASDAFHHYSTVRTWPHHFDTGSLGYLNNTDEINSAVDSIGLGMAIPDAMVEDYYLYTSAWNGNAQPDLSTMPALSNGRWKNGDWKGAVLPLSGVDQAKADAFFMETIEALKSLR